MELKDTVELMLSPNHHDRLDAELIQLDIRIKKLEGILDSYHIEEQLGFSPISSYEMLQIQLNAMITYRSVLNSRIQVELQA